MAARKWVWHYFNQTSLVSSLVLQHVWVCDPTFHHQSSTPLIYDFHKFFTFNEITIPFLYRNIVLHKTSKKYFLHLIFQIPNKYICSLYFIRDYYRLKYSLHILRKYSENCILILVVFYGCHSVSPCSFFPLCFYSSF